MPPVQERCELLSQVEVAPHLWRMELESELISEAVRPGQFTHLRIPDFGGHVLRRPFSIFRADAQHRTITIVYKVVGAGTERMSLLAPGSVFDAVGPIGTGWSLPDSARNVLIIGAGVGAAPVFELAREARDRGMQVTAVLGAQTARELIFQEEYESLGIDVHCATDDGSFGFAGFCTDLARELIASAREPFGYCAVCGPLPVMRIAASLCAEAAIPCEVSIEQRMACGIGACLSCAVDTTAGRKRSCVDGPVFDAQEVVW